MLSSNELWQQAIIISDYHGSTDYHECSAIDSSLSIYFFSINSIISDK